MTSNDLFVLTPDELFVKYSITDIKRKQNELESEINKKKDEIRVLVGEKYRDFVEVSDKISIMNELAKNITNRINVVSSALTSLNINFEETRLSDDHKNSCKNITKNTVAVLIKLLIDVEDQIWTEISNCKFMTATTLLQLSVHIKTMLSLETTWHVNQNFPIIQELWNSILKFPSVLTRLIEETLRGAELSLNTACECFCALTILENLDYTQVIRRFLNLRTETLENTLNTESITSNVRVRILSSLRIIINTSKILYYSFRNSESSDVGSYWKQLQGMVAPHCEPALNLVNLDDITRCGSIYIPIAVQNFKLKMTKPVTPLESYDYNQYFNEWMLLVKDCATQQITNLLALIGSLQTLNLLHESVPPLPRDWPSIMEYFGQKQGTNLWNEIYKPLITERTKTLLLQQWNALFARICHKIDNLIQEISNNKNQESENDLHWFLWEHCEDDLLEKTTPDSKTFLAKGLSMKSCGMSANAGKLCIFVELLVSEVMNELSNISSMKDLETNESIILKHHQQQCAFVLIERLINLTEKLTSAENVPEGVMLFLARFLSGIPRFCVSLKECVLLLNDKSESWIIITAKLQDEYLNIWRKWSNAAVFSVLSEFKLQISEAYSPVFKIKYFPKWDHIKIIEDGNPVDSSLKVPCQASFPIQSLLNVFTSLIGRTLPPKIITMEITNNIICEIFRLIENVKEESVHQMVFIQFAFDVKYLTSLLILVENNDLISRSTCVLDLLEAKIDPVDLDAISSSLSHNVRQFTYRTQGIYALLINNKPRSASEQYSDNADDPHVTYTAAVNLPWFSLLPVSNVHTTMNK